MKILAADDQRLIQLAIKNVLNEIDVELIIAEDGNNAIRLFDLHAPDLCILDLQMPQSNGFDVIHHIRENKRSKTPIIVMSGTSDQQTKLRAFDAGVDDYIVKPVGLQELKVRVLKLLKLPISTAQNAHLGATVNYKGNIQKNIVGVVIPCYNEEERLKTKEFQDFVASNMGYHLCFVNDGSKDNTLGVLKELSKEREDYISVYDCPQNGGKAEAVRLGMLHLAKEVQFDYVGFLDADLSTNFEDFNDLVETMASSKYKIVSGSRISRMGANIAKESSREIISKTINLIIRNILGMKFQDTQCGAKVFTKEVIPLLFEKPFLTRWLFDVELFLRMRKYYGKDKVQSLLCEQPLNRWVHEDGSKLSMKDSIKIVGQLGQIFLHYRLFDKYQKNEILWNQSMVKEYS